MNLYKIPNAITRQYNYEKLLTMYNDTLQGKARYLGIVMGATPQAIEDKRRGVYSYEALRSRLAEGKFSRPGARDLLAPVIRLEPLTAEEMLVLCEKLADMHADLYGYEKSWERTTWRVLSRWNIPGSARSRTSPPERSSGTLLNCWICSIRTQP